MRIRGKLLQNMSLGALADLAVCAMGVAVVAQVAANVWIRVDRPIVSVRQGTDNARPSAPDYKSGDELRWTSKIDLNKGDQTLLMFLRSGCGYCTASMGFYRKLAEMRVARTTTTRLVVFSTDDPATLKDYLQRHDVAVDEAVSLRIDEYQRFRVRGTPTMVLVGRDGVVRRVWIGQLSAFAEREVIEALTVPVTAQQQR